MSRLSGKVALISGAGAGIGRATALLFAREGARVALMDINAESGAETARLISELGHESLFLPTDVTESDQVREAVRKTVDKFGALHILHNNAGGSSAKDASVTDAPEEEFWKKIRIDLFGTWVGCRHALPAIVASGGGSVINMTSIFALIGVHNKDAYTAAKGGISALTRSMAVEYAHANVRVNAVAPGATATERVLHMMKADNSTAGAAKGQLFGMVPPEDVASAVLFLASDESRSTTGHILNVDGGLTIS
ncbi:SDR family NAD(P)-dependent oxidoreductase [Paraburkholderia fungorum]|uniref:SDR family NAD(P)-dependent oxidoreductase n=1 Tax=Paraburkholderia fungorum TaxID=134537 RepID=UPI00209840BA|nr:SDR family oxidoreductase [Paraburkholderia fungorum]USX06824.1 SDR family oxidoreductase [Paraburkholderia fungorum]